MKMTSAILPLIVILTIVFIINPFITGRKLPKRFITKKQVKAKDLRTKKVDIISSIRDIDLENAMGKIQENDYTKLRKAYHSRLDTVNQELDRLGSSDGYSDLKKQVEMEIKLKRTSPRAAVTASRGLLCAACSAENNPESNYCSKCGAKLS